MLDPIVDDAINVETEQFTSGEVNRFKNGSREQVHPSRHYSQSAIEFDEAKIQKALTRLCIPLNADTLIFGGYTGELAVSMRNLGMRVVFTDPMEEWVENAKKRGFEAHSYPAEGLPGELLSRVKLAATFECYIPFTRESTMIYSTLRFLALEHGGLFCESKRTVSDISAEVGAKRLGQFKSTLTPFIKAYGIKVNFTDAGEMKLYHFYAPSEEHRGTIIQDCLCLKALYDNYPKGTVVDNEVLTSLSKLTRVSKEDIISALERYRTAYRAKIKSYGWLADTVPIGKFQLFSKGYSLLME